MVLKTFQAGGGDMAVQAHASVEEFERMAALPENAHKRLEYIGGEMVEVVSNNFASEIGARILIKIGSHVEAHDLGHITGADGGYRVSGEDYIPDVGFISKAKQPNSSLLRGILKRPTWRSRSPRPLTALQ